MDASSKFRSKTAHGESVSNGKKSLAGGSRAQFGDFYSVRVIERKNRTDRSADRFPSAFVTQNFSFKKSYELPLTMATENAGHGVLIESNGAVDFSTDLGERPEPTARGFGRSSAILGANTLVAHDDLSDGLNCAPQSPLFSQCDGPAPTSATATAEDIYGA